MHGLAEDASLWDTLGQILYVSQIRKLRPRKVNQLVQGHMLRKTGQNPIFSTTVLLLPVPLHRAPSRTKLVA